MVANQLSSLAYSNRNPDCYSYNVYQKTKKIETQFKCLGDFLDDAARLTPKKN